MPMNMHPTPIARGQSEDLAQTTPRIHIRSTSLFAAYPGFLAQDAHSESRQGEGYVRKGRWHSARTQLSQGQR